VPTARTSTARSRQRSPRAGRPRRPGSATGARVLIALPWIAFTIFIVAAGGIVFTAAVIGLGIVGLHELYRMLAPVRPIAIAGFLGLAALIATAHFGDQYQMVLVGALTVLAAFAGVIARPERRHSTLAIAVTLLGVAWVGLALAHAVLLRDLDHGDGLLVDVLIATFLGDTGAYFGGRLWGTRPLAPRISPAKTVEGLVCGFAIATLAFSEIIRYVADNWESLTGGNLGLFGYTDSWTTVSGRIDGLLGHLGIEATFLLPLLVVNVVVFVVLAVVVSMLVRSPWGRVLKAIREDEDAVRALGKNTFVYKLESLSIAAAFAAIAGYMLAINISILSPASFDPALTAYGYVIVILGGLGSYLGVAVGSFVLLFLLEATRYLELPLSDARVAALRFMIVGMVLIALVVFRPQGLFGKREELYLRAR